MRRVSVRNSRVVPIEYNPSEREELGRYDLVFSGIANIWEITASVSEEERLRDAVQSSTVVLQKVMVQRSWVISVCE
jgi:hypothetical protein